MVDRTVVKPCPNDNNPTVYPAKIGKDDIKKCNDDFFQFMLDHPELWDLQEPIPTCVVVSVPKPLVINATAAELVQYEEAYGLLLQASGNGTTLAGPSDVASQLLQDAENDLVSHGFATVNGQEVDANRGLDAPLHLTAYLADRLSYTAAFFGDPHMVTLDGLAYSLQELGEFHLLQIPGSRIDVQGRFVASGASVASLGAVATELNGSLVELHPDGTVLVDGQPLDPSVTVTDFGSGASLVQRSGEVDLAYPGAVARLRFQSGSLGVWVAPGVATVGLLGNHNGNVSDDLVTSTGEQLPYNASDNNLHLFGDSWRISDAESFFTYAQDQSTVDFTDMTFPTSTVTLDNFTQAEIDYAGHACSQKGVAAGPQFQDCELDVAQTGDLAYAVAASGVTDFLTDPNAHSVDGNGALTESFDGTIPVNLRPSSVLSVGGSLAAGPIFDTGGYYASIPKIPGHSSATVSVDLLAVNVAPGSSTQQLGTVAVDGWAPTTVSFSSSAASISGGPGTLATLESGTTPDGRPYQRYRLNLSGEHLVAQLGLAVTTSGFSGAAGTGLAVDNLSAQVQLVPPQLFTLPVGSSISDGHPAPGAGNLETKASEDIYSLSTPAGGEGIYLDWQSCPSAGRVEWQMVDASTNNVVGSGDCTAAGKIVMPQGSFLLHVNSAEHSIGTYSLAVFKIPPPDVFAVTLPATISDQVPGPGAGNLETKASEDDYQFNSGTSGIYVNIRGCTNSLRWALRLAGSTTNAAQGGCYDTQLGGLATGNYTLAVTVDQGFTGPYSMQIFNTPVAPQDFQVTSPITISDQQPSPGAGNLETKLSVDRYTFHVPVNQPLYVDLQSCLSDGRLPWRLINLADGSTASNGDGTCTNTQTSPLAVGDYRLEVYSDRAGSGPYALQAWLVPLPPQTFALQAPPAVISQDRPAAGAGNLETKASQDVYTFSLSNNNTTLFVDQVSCSKPGMLHWSLQSVPTPGTTLEVAKGGCSEQQVPSLATGNYQLVVSAVGEGHGTYSLRILAGTAGTPSVAHAPQTSAFSGQSIPIVAATTCQNGTAANCFARLYYRVTAPNSASSPGPWTAEDLHADTTVTNGSSTIIDWSGQIPGSAVTTTGVDYYLIAGDGTNRNALPGGGTPTLGLSDQTTGFGLGVAYTAYLHVTTVSPPIIVDTPPLYTQDSVAVPITVHATCSTAKCAARLHYRQAPIDGLPTIAGDLLGDPGWPTAAMTQTASTPVPTAPSVGPTGTVLPAGPPGSLLTFTATIPASVVTTTGVDYYIDVTDATTTSYDPGTAYQGYYAPTDGMRSAYHHIHVLEPSHIVSAPAATGAYHAPIPVTATTNCSNGVTCLATVYWRTTPTAGSVLDNSSGFTSAAMTVTAGPAAGTVNLTAAIPGAFADTRGVDYFFSVTDGTTTTWYPGTSQVDGYLAVSGTRVGYVHTHVLEPVHLAPQPTVTAPALQDLTITTQMTCATQACTANLVYTTDPRSPTAPLTTVAMTKTASVATATTTIRLETWQATIPAAQVTTRGIGYYLTATDGYTQTAAPGLTYLGDYIVVTGGSPIQLSGSIAVSGVITLQNTVMPGAVAMFPVHILEQPHVIHQPVLTAPSSTPVPVTARSNCSSPTCTASIQYRPAGAATWTTVTMAATALNPTQPLWTFTATIPATAWSPSGIEYAVTVTDGYTSDTTPAYPIQPQP